MTVSDNQEGMLRFVLAYKDFECIDCDSNPELEITKEGFHIAQCPGCGQRATEKDIHKFFREIKGYSSNSKIAFELIRDPIKGRAIFEKVDQTFKAISEEYL